ncbi:MAG TPA: hypothetical protein VGK26_13220 [Thermoanaerobaculia bacterium]
MVAALATLAPAFAFGQAPPVTPNLDELMRQAPGGANRGGRSQGPAPPGVPVPADSPLIAAFKRLDAAKAYRVRMEMSATDPRALQSMQQMGMGNFEKAVVKPDTQSVTLHMKLPSVDAPGKSDDWTVLAVVKGKRAARKFDTPAKEHILAMQEASIARQFAQADMAATTSLAQAVASGPMGWASGAVQMASLLMSHAEAASALKKSREFFEWTCQDAPASASATHSADSVTFTDLVDLGDRTDGDVPVHGYRFYVLEQGRSQGPVEVDVAKTTGLPTRFAMSEPSMGASMVMHYSGYDRPAEIEIPPCLAK